MPVSGVTLVHLREALSFSYDRLHVIVTDEPANLSQNRIQATKYRITQGICTDYLHAESVPVTPVTDAVGEST